MQIDGYIFVRMVKLPGHCRGVTIPNTDSTFDVYINSSLPEELQQAALEHELNHIRMDHFYADKPVMVKEKEAG